MIETVCLMFVENFYYFFIFYTIDVLLKLAVVQTCTKIWQAGLTLIFCSRSIRTYIQLLKVLWIHHVTTSKQS